MPRYTDPDQDKTNPRPSAIHQRFDDEAEEREVYQIEQYDVMDDETVDRARFGLYDPIFGINTLEPALEEDREESFFTTLGRTLGSSGSLYPDEYERQHAGAEEDEDLNQQQVNVEGYFTPAYDPYGDESEPKETRPAANDEDER